MSKHAAPVAVIHPYRIMVAGLWLKIFRQSNKHTALTRWVDLQEEIQEI